MDILSSKHNKNLWQKLTIDKGSAIGDIVIKLSQYWIGNNILDAGAGDGFIVDSIAKKFKNKKIIGVDLVSKNKNILGGDLTNLNFANNFFDTIISTDVIEHLNDVDLKRVIDELYRVLGSGGYLILSTRYKENLTKHLCICPFCNKEFHRYGHQQSFDKVRIREIFRLEEWELIKFQPINFYFYKKFKFFAKVLYFLKFDYFVREKLHKKYFQPDLFIIFKKR